MHLAERILRKEEIKWALMLLTTVSLKGCSESKNQLIKLSCTREKSVSARFYWT